MDTGSGDPGAQRQLRYGQVHSIAFKTQTCCAPCLDGLGQHHPPCVESRRAPPKIRFKTVGATPRSSRAALRTPIRRKMRRCYPVLASPSGSRGGDRPTVGTQERAPLASRILNEALLRHRLEEKK